MAFCGQQQKAHTAVCAAGLTQALPEACNLETIWRQRSLSPAPSMQTLRPGEEVLC